MLFDKNNVACGANVTMSGKSGYKVMVNRLNGMFTKFNKGDSEDVQGFEDDAKIVGIVYSDVNDGFTMVFKFKRKECFN